jgi:hypothetical protein
MKSHSRFLLVLVGVVLGIAGTLTFSPGSATATPAQQPGEKSYKILDLSKLKTVSAGEQALNEAAKGGWRVVGTLGQQLVMFEK